MVAKKPEEEKREQQRMQDVLVLLQHLAENEETTIKLIIECLLDVGAVNFINRKVQNTSLNQFAKAIASMSKPVAKRYGLYWFKKNCPELIVNWLQRKVAFPPPQKMPVVEAEVKNQPDILQAVEVAEAQAESSQTVTTLSDPVGASLPLEENKMQPTTVVASVVKGSDAVGEDSVVKPPQPVGPSDALIASEPEQSTLNQLPIELSSLQSVASNDAEQSVESAETIAGLNGSEVVAAPSSTGVAQLTQAGFQPPMPTDVISHPAIDDVSNFQGPTNRKTHQVQQLQTQVKVLAGSLMGTVLLSGAMMLHFHATQQNALQLQRSTPSSIAPISQPVE